MSFSSTNNSAINTSSNFSLRQAKHCMTFLWKEKYFRSAPDGILMAHAKWLLIPSSLGLHKKYLSTQYSECFRVLAGPFSKGTVPLEDSNVPFGSAPKSTMCHLGLRQNPHTYSWVQCSLSSIFRAQTVFLSSVAIKMLCWQRYTCNKCLVLIFKMRGVVMRDCLHPLAYKLVGT